MKKLMILVLISLMVMSSSMMVFADETNEVREEKRVERVDKLTELFEIYNQEGLQDFLSYVNAHQAFHQMATMTHENFRTSVEAEKAAIKALIETEDYTREEIRTMITEFREKMTDFKENANLIKDSKKVALDLEKGIWVSTHESLKAALSSENIDGEAVKALLNEILDLSQTHLSIDNLYYNQFLELISNF